MTAGRGKPKALVEMDHPHAVWIRVPPQQGLGQKLNALHDAASAIGEHARTARTHHTGDFVRFGFKAGEHATVFRGAATVICAELVEAGEPPTRGVK
jgi:hypothetical protein